MVLNHNNIWQMTNTTMIGEIHLNMHPESEIKNGAENDLN